MADKDPGGKDRAGKDQGDKGTKRFPWLIARCLESRKPGRRRPYYLTWRTTGRSAGSSGKH